MSDIPSVAPVKLVRALEKLGCTVTRQRGSHVYLIHPEKQTRTCVAIHPGEMRREHVKTILKQINIPVEELKKVL